MRVSGARLSLYVSEHHCGKTEIMCRSVPEAFGALPNVR